MSRRAAEFILVSDDEDVDKNVCSSEGEREEKGRSGAVVLEGGWKMIPRSWSEYRVMLMVSWEWF